MSRTKLYLRLQSQLIFAAVIGSCIVSSATSMLARANYDSSANNITQSNLAEAGGVEQVVLYDALTKTTQGQRHGGQFVVDGGWQVTGVEDMIVYDLGRYIENGSAELEVRNFKPDEQSTHYRHHFLSMFRNPWGNHHPVENQEIGWDLHAGFNYGEGVKMLSWTYDANTGQSTVVREAWDKNRVYRLKVTWQGRHLQYFRDGVLYVTHTHDSDMQLRYLFLGRDFTVSADLVTDFKNNQYPALVVMPQLRVDNGLPTD